MGESENTDARISLSINVADLQQSLIQAIRDGVFTEGVRAHISQMLEGKDWQKEWWLKQTAEEFLKKHIERMVDAFMEVQENREKVQKAVYEMMVDDLPREVLKNIVEKLGK